MRRASEAPDFWVPEDHMFKTGGECLEAFPDQAAAGAYKSKWQTKYDSAITVLQAIARDGERSAIKYTPANQAGHALALFGEHVPTNEFKLKEG